MAFLNWVRLVISPFVWAGHQRDAGPLFLNTEGNEGNEGKTGTGIKIRKVGRQERVKTSNSKPQASSVQTPTVADDEVYLFITREYDTSGLKENGTIPFYCRFFKKVFIREFRELTRTSVALDSSFDTRLKCAESPEVAFGVSQVELGAAVRECRGSCNMNGTDDVGSFGTGMFIGLADDIRVFCD
jgi:hypothetical protein